MLRYALLLVALFVVGVGLNLAANHFLYAPETEASHSTDEEVEKSDSSPDVSGIPVTGMNGSESTTGENPGGESQPPTNWARLADASPALPVDDEDSEAFVELVRAGDKFLLAGNTRAAAVKYNKADSLDRTRSAALTNKRALCTEINGDHNRAEELYSEVISRRTDLSQQFVAQMGLIRCWKQLNKQADSHRRLADLFLNFEALAGQPEVIQAELFHELASSFQDQALRAYHHDPSRIDGILFDRPPINVDSILHTINNPPSPGGADDSRSGIDVVQQPRPIAGLTFVSARIKAINMQQLIIQLVQKSGLVLRLSPAAEKRMRAYSKGVDFQNFSLALVLDALLQPADLRWEQRDDELHVFSPSELPQDQAADPAPPVLETALLHSADRFLQKFALTFPDDYRAESATLARANLQFLMANHETAANLFELVRQSDPRGELGAMLAFNRGKLNTVAGRNDMALEDFYLAVDQSYNPLIQSTGYWLIGKWYLERNQFPESIRAFGRALSTARSGLQKQRAALELAIAYLLNNDPASANQVVFANRSSFDEKTRSLALIVSNYAQYIGVEDVHSRSVAEKRLIESLALRNRLGTDWFVEYYIAGRAYQELGIPDLAMQMFEQGMNAATHPEWKYRLKFALAMEKTRSLQNLDASQLLQELVEEGTDPWKVLAASRLATLYQANAMHRECIEVGERALAIEMSDEQRNRLLVTLGRSFRALGQHHASALCFAGVFTPELPSEVN